MTVPSGAALIDVGNDSATVQSAIPVATANRNPQSLVLSPYNGNLYMMQVDEANENGNLTLNRYKKNSASNWVLNANMALSRFGHGVAFGIWYDEETSTQHFFSECAVGSTGRGERLNNFIFSAGGSFNQSGGPVYDPGLGESYSCAVDPTNTFITIRYKADDSWHYQAYNIEEFMAANYSNPLIDDGGLDEVPDDNMAGSTNSLQGWTVAGHYLYTLSETTEQQGSVPPKTSRLRSYDMNHTENTAAGYIAVARHGQPSNLDTGEFEGLTFGDSEYALYYMIRTASKGTHTFNLHGIRHNS